MTGTVVMVAAVVMRAMLGSLPIQNAGLVVYLLVMNLLGIFGVCFAFAALTLRIRESASSLANLLQFAYLIFGVSFFPFGALPNWMQVISKLIPLSYGVDIFRSALMGFPPGFPEIAPFEVELAIITCFGLVMPFLGYKAYRRAKIRARQNETLSVY